MQLDQLTLDDLSILKGENAVYLLLDKCHTKEGSLLLRKRLQEPYAQRDDMLRYQEAVRFWSAHGQDFKWELTNGTVMMLQQFLHSNEFADKVNDDLGLRINTFLKKIVHRESLDHISFLTEQIILLLRDGRKIQQVLEQGGSQLPDYLQQDRAALAEALQHPAVKVYDAHTEKRAMAAKIAMIHQLKRYGRNMLEKIITVISRIDVIMVMSGWAAREGWSLPEVLPQERLVLSAQQLFHPLIPDAHPYDITFDRQHQLLLLTGANMSGKSTFMRTVGLCAILAHCGYPVPAQSMEISCLNALITQIQVQDDLSKGESYFYAEVLRMKQTAQRIRQQSYNLIIMDELFKGTNVHDAYDCSVAVVKGLLKKGNNLILLSTHLHELPEQLERSEGLFFRYFETLIDGEKNFKFTYRLKEGISKDRIGYALLKQEGVIDLLN